MKSVSIIILSLLTSYNVVVAKSVESFKYNLAYYYDQYDQVDVNDIPQQVFDNVDVFPFNNGLENGIYWFKVDVINSTSKVQSTIFEIREPYIKKSAIYENNGTKMVLLDRSGNDVPMSRKTISTRNISYPVDLESGNNEFYLKTSFHRNTNFNFYIHKTISFFNNQSFYASMYGMYYGIGILIILINICCYNMTFDKLYIYYAVAVFFQLLLFMHLDGIMTFILHPGWLLDNIDILCYLALPIVLGYYFSGDFLHIRIHYPKLYILEYILIGLNSVLLIIFLLGNNVLFFALGCSFTLINMIYYWSIAFTLIKKEKYAGFFVIAYSLLLFLALGFAVPVMFGFDLIQGEVWILKVGSIVEMLIFLYLLVSKSYKLKLNSETESDVSLSNVKLVVPIALNGLDVSVLHDVLHQQYAITNREFEVLSFIVSEDLTYRQLAEKMILSVNTVKFHIRNIYSKLDVTGKKEMIAKLQQVNNE